MAFKKRTSLSGLTGSKWMDWALRRTGVAMPNCFTYATARISEILGREEYLDSPRVNGAQELWDNYSDGFKRSKYAVEGALMIWQSGQWGHVAVCEELIDTNTIAWSQSNYGGAAFEYVKGNPNGYKGMHFLGYLVHDKLPKAEAAKPSTSKPTTTGIKAGNKVKIKSSAKKYATGQTIPAWAKGKTYTVQQVSGSKALIKELVSWVKISDLQVTGAAAVIAVGKKVKVKKTAKTYATGQSIPAFVKGTTYTVMQISGEKVLLKEIMRWVRKSDLE